MPQYDNNLTGALFKNDSKEKETHPDYKGSCEINGEEFWIAAWLKTSKSGSKFMSLRFESKADAKPAGKPKGKPAAEPAAEEDVPF